MSVNEESSLLLQKDFHDAPKGVHLEGRVVLTALKDVPLEVRRREAKEPLFLTRYE